MRVRAARHDDAPALAALRWEFRAEGGALLGHVVCQVVPLVPRPCRLDDACGVITDNYVRPAYRDRGVGAALLDRSPHAG